ncbi:hypothetical protein HMPREF9622_00492 [Cutibacterium modestum HL037PA3]|uniref:Uncharacterized protein n=1 Tax=Cutibacterium modestum HL044PA1 TaxID=765109 RepID=A0ABN0C8M2_9ACTN|nr:hypothetical protein HMPREF9621_01216 [Cutibacterium modestum HL037PA2]EFS93588.1 hypothetical protein HMPREF9607_00042 [Cutibacterium modestum HL044PA1]EFT16287.1 hypothetical protein HMPREF9622_00492 [Cutibacterium modestum HL037PA3]EGG27379.1 hypothetical protein PA08_0645 [Cutibacterium modestum P08]
MVRYTGSCGYYKANSNDGMEKPIGVRWINEGFREDAWLSKCDDVI